MILSIDLVKMVFLFSYKYGIPKKWYSSLENMVFPMTEKRKIIKQFT